MSAGAARPGRVPPLATALLAGALAAQLALRASQPAPQALAEALGAPPPAPWVRAASLGEAAVAGQWLALQLQAFDNQPGISIPFLRLDYARLTQWLGRILELNPDGAYPMLMATHVYGQVADPARVRQMLEFVRGRFLADPARHWRWMAHAAVLARHRLQDPALALAYAQLLAQHTGGLRVPGWVRQMHVLLLADLGETRTARVLLGGMLASGAITDPREQHFLAGRLDALEHVDNPTTLSQSGHPPAATPGPPAPGTPPSPGKN